MKHIKRLLTIFGVLAMCSGLLFGAWQIWFNPHRGVVRNFEYSKDIETVLTSEQALEDLDYIIDRVLKRHPACIDGLPDEIADAYETERTLLSEKTEVSVLELWQSTSRVLATLGDGHTAVRAYVDDVLFLPFSFAWSENNLICIGGEYDGEVVKEIGGVAVDDLFAKFCEQFSYELESYAKFVFAARINRSDYLSFVGVDVGDEVEVVFAGNDTSENSRADFKLQQNETESNKSDEPFIEYSLNEKEGYATLTLRQCIYDDTYINTLKTFFNAVNDKNIENVIVDLRDNPGGNSMVANEFIGYLPVEEYKSFGANVRFGMFLLEQSPQETKNKQKEPQFSGDVFVLTNTATFSAAMDFTVLLSDNGLCTVVGEIPGNMPSSYGDILYFRTLNANLTFSVSYKYFMRPDTTKNDLPLIPDIEVTSEDAMDKAIELISE